MSDVRAAMDFDMVRAGADRIGQAAQAFEQGGRQVGGVPPAAAPRQQATDLLDRFIEAMAGAFRVAESELTHHSTALAATLDSYQQAEAVLANWHVPGLSG
jgi:hypothetical protein